MKSKFLLFTTGMILVAQTLVAQVPSYVPTNGLVGYWPFNGNANDESGNGNNGTVNGATLTTDRNGNTNSAYNFNGSSNYIRINNSTSLNSTSISISGWFNTNNLATNDNLDAKGIIGKWWQTPSVCNSNYNAYLVCLTKPLSQSSTFVGGATSFYEGNVFYANTPISTNNWYHFVFVHNSTSGGKLYINGNLVNSNSSTGSICNSLNALNIGADINNGSLYRFFNGKIDDIGVWNRTLTQQEITNLYNGVNYSDTCNAVSGSLVNGLVGYWPFCGNANDDSGNGNNGTVNGATLTADRFGNSNSAYSFDGVNDEIHIGQLNLTSNYSISFWSNINNSQFQYPIGFGVNQTNTVDLFKGYGIGYSSTVSQCPGLTSSKYFVFDAVSTCNNFIECNNIISPSQWNHVVMTKNGNLVSIYINGTIENSNTNLNLQGIINLYFGVRSDLFAYFNGKLDDIGIWNRALTPSEVTQLYNQNQCFTNITVTDTLIINVGQLSYTNPITYANNITIAPNPASTQININFNNISNLNGGTIKIINALGQQVATTPITTSGTNTTMSLATWGGNGMYFVQIINPQGQIVDIKKIILQ